MVLANGTIGAKLHISFPVLNRSSFGFWLSYFSVVSRIVLAMFWFGIQVRGHFAQESYKYNICLSVTQVGSRFIRCSKQFGRRWRTCQITFLKVLE